jgi:ankyrin repeat protein
MLVTTHARSSRPRRAPRITLFVRAALSAVIAGGCAATPDPKSPETAASASEALFAAASSGDVAAVRRALARRAPVTARRPEGGVTPLHLAAEGGHDRAARRLISAGAQVNARDDRGRTPLHAAVVAGHEVTERLIGNAFDVRVEVVGLPAPDLTPGHLRVIDLLLASKTDVEATDRDKKSAALLAAERGHADVLARLLRAGANPNVVFPSGLPAVHLAADRGFAGVVDVLLDAGADADSRSASGKAPLHYAVEKGHADVVDLLLARGADVDARNPALWTPLHVAALFAQDDIARILLEAGADRSARTSADMTPSEIARRQGNAQTAALLALVQNGAGSSMFPSSPGR